MPIAVLLSGGLDSAVLLHRLLTRGEPGLPVGRRILPLYLRGGLRWERMELYWLRRFLHAVRSPRLLPLAIMDVPLRSTYHAHWSLTGRRIPGARSPDHAVELPGRNLLLVSHAAIVCAQRRVTTIAVGVLHGNPFGDATPRFFADLAAIVSQALHRSLRILTPLRGLSKAQVIRSASGVPFHLTFSCLRPRGRLHCGRCNKCAERQRAFRLAGVADPTAYARQEQ